MADAAARVLIKFNGVSESDTEQMVQAQLEVAHLLSAPVQAKGAADRHFGSNEEFWQAVLSERLRVGTAIFLEDFVVSEWIPRSPGLYHTATGARHRIMALDHLIADSGRALGTSEIITPASQGIVFDAYGKLDMLYGGVGCLRLRDQYIRHLGSRVWFMSASSNGIAHEGVPLALDSAAYGNLIDRIKADGGIACDLTGKLQFVPRRLRSLYEGYRGVPQLYLLVESLKTVPVSVTEDRVPAVSLAAMFLALGNGTRSHPFATYVTCAPSTPSSIAQGTAWIEDVYVRGLYGGRVITDFDEQVNRFADATFSLDKILGATLDLSEITDLGRQSWSLQWLRRKGPMIVNDNRQIITNSTIHGPVINQADRVQVRVLAKITAPFTQPRWG